MKRTSTPIHLVARVMKTGQILWALLLLATLFSACKNENEEPTPLAKPTLDKIEVGLSNNGLGVIDRDFHLNAEVLAGDKIEDVQIKIQQRPGEQYTKAWQHEITWDQYKGAKNATIHKHFTIPADAAEGKYDFLIIVRDQNGAKLEEKRSLTIYSAANLPVDPTLAIFNVLKTGGGASGLFYWREAFITPGDKFNKNDSLSAQVTINGVKGDGKMYLLLIPKAANHRPESLEQIDFSKAIVYDVHEHKGLTSVGSLSNFEFDEPTFTIVRGLPELIIGAAKDNNTPVPTPISGAKAWQSGSYYLGVIYKNTTYNMTLFKYIDFPINYN